MTIRPSVVNFDYGMADGVKKTFRRYYTRNLAKALLLWHDDMDDPESDLKALREKLEEETGLYPHLEHCQEYMAAELPCLVEKYGDEERMKKAQS